MTISTQTRTAGPFTTNGSTTAFPFAFKCFAAGDIVVVKRVTATGVESNLVLNTDYTVSLNANQDANPGGTVNTVGALGAGFTLTLTTNLQYLQPTDLTNQGGFYPKVITTALDRLTIFTQQLFGLANRALKFPISDGNLDATLPGKDQRKGKVLAFHETTGLPVAGPTIADTGTVAGIAADIAAVAAIAADVTIAADNVADITNFSGVYLGPRSSDPATRTDGSPLQPGDLYFNTVNSVLRTYNGTQWQEAITGSVAVQRFVGDGATTSFQLNTAPDNENVVQVFIGGIYQSKTEYNITGSNADILTFSAAPPNGAAIEAVTFSVLPLGVVDANQVQIPGVPNGDLGRKYLETVSVKDYGALGDGVADDTMAIQAALNSGAGYVFFPKGTYKITASLVVASNTVIYGAGAQTLIQVAANGVDAFTTGTSPFKINITIRSLAIDGGGQTTNINTGFRQCRGVYATNISNLRLEDLIIRKMGCINPANAQDDATWGGYGIFVTSRFGTATNVRINRCTVIDIAGGGIQYGDGINVDAHEAFVGASYMDVIVSNCYVTRVGRHCYTVGGGAGESMAAGIKFLHCYGEKAACDWLDIEEGVDILVDGCTIVSCGNDTYYYNPVTAFGATYRLLAAIATGNESKNIVIKNTKMRNCYYGITYGATSGLTIDTVEIENSTTADVQQGLANGATGFKVINSKFKTVNKPIFNNYTPGALGEMEIIGCDFYSKFVTFSTKGGQFSDNTFRAGFEFKGSGLDNSKNVIRSCKFLDYAGVGIITANNQTLPDNTIEDCDFLGTGNMTVGINLAFNSTRRWKIRGNRFYSLTTAGINSEYGNGQHHADMDLNEFHSCANGILLQQSIADASISGNKFHSITGWCIRIYDIDSSTLMSNGPKIRDNTAYANCVNGLQISLNAGGSYNYTMIVGNDMHNCSGTKWSLAAGNANGVVANNITA